MSPHRHPANVARHDDRTFGQRAADATTDVMGSWRFIWAQAGFIVLWVGLNTLGGIRHWDPYTFTLLNLLFSVQAAFASPLILLAQNRQTEHDRLKAEHDYLVNEESLRLLRLMVPAETAVAEALAETAEQDGTP